MSAPRERRTPGGTTTYRAPAQRRALEAALAGRLVRVNRLTDALLALADGRSLGPDRRAVRADARTVAPVEHELRAIGAACTAAAEAIGAARARAGPEGALERAGDGDELRQADLQVPAEALAAALRGS